MLSLGVEENWLLAHTFISVRSFYLIGCCQTALRYFILFDCDGPVFVLLFSYKSAINCSRCMLCSRNSSAERDSYRTSTYICILTIQLLLQPVLAI